ncbi:MAG: tetratricopeptide repeat protein [Proteobacteria bacterium]|nr:tetratricopeptide repeat protein [Pseudomonadota bacterium]
MLFLFSFVALVLASGPAVAAPGSSVSETSASASTVTNINFTDSGQHRYATHLLESGDYRGAAREFSRLIENFPLSSFVAPAQLGMARAHFSSGRYTEAERGARLYLKNFPESKELDTALELFRRARSARNTPPVAPALKPEKLSAQTGSVASSGAIKAVQIPLFLQSDYSDIGIEMARLKASGLDTVIVRVFHNAGDRYYASADPVDGVWNETGVYFKTDHAPVIDDVLGPLVELAHANGLKIFAWMTTRYADYGLEHRSDLACGAYDLKKKRGVRCKGLDLFNEEAVEHLEALYSDLAEYAIDGILFQDDLVLRQTEGFGERAETLFEAEFGSAPAPERLYISKGPGRSVDYTPLFWRWAAWKNARLLEVASRLKSVVKTKNPEARFAINLMYESVTNPPYALAWLSQDLTAAVEVGFDYYSIMAYHRQMESELNKRPIAIRGLIGKMVADATRTVKEPSKVLVKLQIVDWETGESVEDGEVTEILKEISHSLPVSLAVVPYRDDFPYSELSTKNGEALLGRTSAR